MSLTGAHADVMANATFYRFWVDLIRRGWKVLYGVNLLVAGETSFAQFQSCRIQLKDKLRDATELKRWSAYLDGLDLTDVLSDTPQPNPSPRAAPQVTAAPAPSLAAGNLPAAKASRSKITDVDDLTPNQFLNAISEVAARFGKPGEAVKAELPSFLRACFEEIESRTGLDIRCNVGANRHFPRLLRWIREFAAGYEGYDPAGFVVQNAGGRGPVAANPTDPRMLRVSIKWDYL